jgi:hypothetical protein
MVSTARWTNDGERATKQLVGDDSHPTKGVS